MILDTSALIALLRQEPESDAIGEVVLANRGKLRISAATYIEAGIVFDTNKDHRLADRLDALIQKFEIQIVPVAFEQARHARYAYRNFGKGNHPARLNFGDCFAYALSKATGEPLLFKGDDFGHTDVLPA
jgi:ribonuclease VapC